MNIIYQSLKKNFVYLVGLHVYCKMIDTRSPQYQVKLNEPLIFWADFEKYPSVKFNENLSSEMRAVPQTDRRTDGQTDRQS
jgi:hypothetical protein